MSSRLCRLCSRPSRSERGYCKKHDMAYQEVQRKYSDWKLAYENISWERYLETIKGLKETGDLAKTVADEELRTGSGL
jgi:hypothetical protein